MKSPLSTIFLVLLAATAFGGEVRVFTALSGRTMKGELVAVSGNSVTIKREDGMSFTLEATAFSPTDLEFFKAHGWKPSPFKSQPVEKLPSLPSGAATTTLGTKVDKTEKIGGNSGKPFMEIPPGPVLLGGFDITLSGEGGDATIGTLQPIWLTKSGPQLGMIHGKPVGHETARIEAKSGYAVGALEGRGGIFLRGFKVIFMRIKGRELDPSDSYASDFYGALKAGSASPTGNGKAIVGIYGANDEMMNSLGLVFDTSSAGSAEPAVAKTEGGARGGIKGKFYLSIDDTVKIFLNGIETFSVDSAQITESPDVELKPGDRLVAQLRNQGGPRHFMLLFVSSDHQTAVSFQHTSFRIFSDPHLTDFNLIDFDKQSKYAKQDSRKRDKPLPFKNHSEWIWGEADITAIGTLLTKEMFESLPK